MKVSVCDFRSDSFEKDFINSLKRTGFAVITRHGIDSSLINQAQSIWREFFLLSEEEKQFFANSENPNMGYKSFGQEKAVGASKADLKAFFHWKPGQNIPEEALAITQKMFYELEDISGKLLRIIDWDLNRYSDFCYKACLQSDNTILRVLYYPAMDFSKEDAVRAAAHEDINFITLLVAASAAGLQVRNHAGEWYDVPHEDNSIIVNVGDMLQLASRGLYRSTTHRVVNPKNQTEDRISMPLFIHPASDTLLVEGITAKQFLDQRLKEIYLRS